MKTTNKIKRQPAEWKKILSIVYLLKCWYPKYIKTHIIQQQKLKQYD